MLKSAEALDKTIPVRLDDTVWAPEPVEPTEVVELKETDAELVGNPKVIVSEELVSATKVEVKAVLVESVEMV